MAQSNQSAQAVESVEKTEVAKKAAKTASTRAAKTATTSTATEATKTTVTKASATKRTVTSRTARTTATKATTAVRSARTSKAAATKSATAKRPASSAVFNARLAAHQDELEQLFMSLYHDAFDALVASMAAAYADRPADLKRLDKTREQDPGWYQARRYVRHDHVHDLFAGDLKKSCRQDSVLEGSRSSPTCT